MADPSDAPSPLPIGVLLAAGRGRRMGGRKQFYPVATESGEKPLVVAAFDSIAKVCRTNIVVVGHLAEEVTAVLAGREFKYVLANADAPMFHSIQIGMRSAQAIDPSASVLLQLGDHPYVAPATLPLLLAAAAEQPDKAVMPMYEGQGGHPVLVPPNLIRDLLAANCSDGLRGFWNEHPECCLRLVVEDADVVRDIDTVV